MAFTKQYASLDGNRRGRGNGAIHSYLPRRRSCLSLNNVFLKVKQASLAALSLLALSFLLPLSATAQNDSSGFALTTPISDQPARSSSDLNLETVSSHDLFISASADAAAGRLESAVLKYKEVVRREPTNVSARNNLAVCLKLQGNKEAALQEFEKTLAQSPNQPELYNNLATSQIALGKYDQALDSLYKALRLKPDFSDAHRNLAHVLSLKGDNEGAVTAYQEAIQEAGAKWQKAPPSDQVKGEDAKSTEPDADVKLPSDAAARAQLGDLRYELGDCLRLVRRFEQALLEYKTTLKLCSQSSDDFKESVKLKCAKCYEGMGRYEEARQILNELLEKSPDDTDALNCLGVVLWQMKQLPESVYVLERALKLEPAYPQARNNLGIALYELKRYDEAVNVWRQALSLKPDYPEAHYNMGVALYQSGLYDQAVEAYKECLTYAPNDANAHNNLGLALLRLGNKAEALAQWRKAIECDANCAEAYTNLGKLLKETAVQPQ